ncbi:MAG: carboxymuconolactone decarboxylase family protein, partial [Planctomycetia bacterium]|nr:carboxymuconolactone decarboxylase family protein [Planctomycetia bacterium]
MFTTVALLYGALAQWKSPLAPALRSLVTVRVSQINYCTFCVNLNSATLAKRGVSMEKIDALPDWRNSRFFTPEEHRTLEYAEAMPHNNVDDNLHGRLKRIWHDDTIVERTALIAFQNRSSKCNAASGHTITGILPPAGLTLSRTGRQLPLVRGVMGPRRFGSKSKTSVEHASAQNEIYFLIVIRDKFQNSAVNLGNSSPAPGNFPLIVEIFHAMIRQLPCWNRAKMADP